MLLLNLHSNKAEHLQMIQYLFEQMQLSVITVLFPLVFTLHCLFCFFCFGLGEMLNRSEECWRVVLEGRNHSLIAVTGFTDGRSQSFTVPFSLNRNLFSI